MHLELNQELKKSLPLEEDAFGHFFRSNGTTPRDAKHRSSYEDQICDLHFYVKRLLGEAIALLRLCLAHQAGNSLSKWGNGQELPSYK